MSHLFSGVMPAVWSNLIAVGVAWWRLHSQVARQHAEAVAQAVRHHTAARDQAAAQHDDLKRQLASHCADLKSHITAVGAHVATASVAVPQQLLDDIAKRVAPGSSTSTGKGG